MIRITIAQLEAFYWTATLGTVEAAAHRLNLSQPSVSQRLKTLQAEFDQPLTERVGRGLKVTAKGQDLLLRAGRILGEVEAMAEEPDPARLRGPLRLGMAEGLALVCLPELMRRLRDVHPLMSIEVSAGISADLEPRLHDHELDIAFLVNPTEHPDMTSVPLGIQETSWVAASHWNLPDIVRPQDLIDLPVITNEPGSINARQVKGWFASASLMPRRQDTCNSVAMLSHLVTRGAAVGILPVRVARAATNGDDMRILRTVPPVADTPIHAVFRSQSLSVPARTTLGVARQLLDELGYSGSRK